MLSCIQGQPCDPLSKKDPDTCGSNIAYAYFVSFIFFCSFLVIFVLFMAFTTTRASNDKFNPTLDTIISILDVEFVRCCHYGQLRLFDKRFVDLRRASFRRIYSNLGRI